ncbi:hypothetical protein PG985_010828 [Apiospora marii]|uniref:Major facilitator superfamily transporter n=1 Tax=Apiospora marii TaxID=335849 RepID=A0ABR1T223_9PEZI
MDKVSSFLRKSSSFGSMISAKNEIYLPVNTKPQSKKFRLRQILGHCLYRRVVIWTLVLILLLSLTLFNPRLTTKTRQDVLDLVQLGKGQLKETHVEKGDEIVLQTQDGAVVEEKKEPVEEQKEEEEEPEDDGQNGPHWMRYKHMDGYYKGLRAIVPFAEYTPEYPAPTGSKPTIPVSAPHHSKLPTPTPYSPHPDYDSSEYKSEYHKVQPCYLDAAKKTPVPDVYAYSGVPQGQAKPAMGSYDLLGMREDVCFDRFSRYGAYGLGYTAKEGGTGEAMDTDHEGNEAVWEKHGKVNWENMDWAAAQERCFVSNENRFYTGNSTQDAEYAKLRPKRIDRTAIVIRTYVGFKWTAHALLNFRAMISELNLQSGGEYDVHFLLHVRDNNMPIWADPQTAQDILDENVPREFHGICTLWSEAQMNLYYPGDFGEAFDNPSNGDIHGVYRSAHMPLQHFAQMHPEYAHFWNWEMDMRWTGSYYELFDRLGKWGAQQSRQGMWERASKYYIPALHGDWANFTKTVERETQASGRRSIMGPVIFAGKNNLQQGEGGFMPKSCATGSDMTKCGMGEDADLITLNPLFDTNESGWVFASDVTGYDKQYPIPPRRCAIVTASRLSRRLLSAMHEETWRMHHGMFSEMFPPSMAFHHGLKAVYAPHPVYVDRAWPAEEIEKHFNGGRDHTSGGHGSPFDLQNEHNHKGTSWYYNSEFAGLLWRRWLGYAQMDGRGKNGGRSGEGDLRGGREEEADPNNSGRLCLRSMLVHPIKWENPSERDN